MLKASLIALGVMAALPIAAQANETTMIRKGGDTGFFAGASIGQTKLTVTSSEIAGSGSAHETGFKALGGYRFNRWFSIEGAYYYPGSFQEAEDDQSVRLRANIFQLSAVGTFPIAGPVDGFARIGAAYWDAKLSACDGTLCGSLDDNGAEFNWGAGLQMSVTPQLNLRLEFEQTKIDQAIGTLPVEWKLQYLQLGFNYLF